MIFRPLHKTTRREGDWWLHFVGRLRKDDDDNDVLITQIQRIFRESSAIIFRVFYLFFLCNLRACILTF